MKQHIKNYIRFYNIGEQDIMLCKNCGGVAVDIHHILFRSQGGTDGIANLIALCRSCHDRAHFKKEPYIKREELDYLIRKYLCSKSQ